MTSTQLKKYLYLFFKVALFFVLLYVIYWQIKSRSETVNLFEAFTSDFNSKRFPFLLVAIALMPLNWFLESVKWRTFVSRIQEKFNLFLAFQSVICGAMFGFITPNRIGEFGGRLYGVKKENRMKSITAGYWGGAAQFFVTFSLGAIMGWETLVKELDINKTSWFVIPSLLFIASGVLVLFFNFEKAVRTFQRFPLIRKLMKKYAFGFDMPKSALFQVLFITITRYLIYVTQYMLVLTFFGINLPISILFAAVTTMLLIHTTVPSVPFFDLVVKGSLVPLLAPYTNNDIGIILSIFTIWILNIVIPALVGYGFFLKVKANKKEAPVLETSAHA